MSEPIIKTTTNILGPIELPLCDCIWRDQLEREREADRAAIRDMKHAMMAASRDLFALKEPTRAHRLLDVTQKHRETIQRAQDAI